MPEEQVVEEKEKDKELNFRALESKYQKQLEEMERQKQELQEQLERQMTNVIEDDDEPYIDKKNLKKALEKFGEHTTKKTKSDINSAIQQAIYEDRRQRWLEENKDFEEVIKNYANKLYEVNPRLANTILKMPEGFERQQLAYENIKALGLDKPQEKEPSIQDKINQNKKSPYYQPTGVGTAPYAAAGDYSKEGQKQAYSRMKELQQRLGIS